MFLCVLILMDVKKVNVNEINVGVLAYIGDAVYEVNVRNYLVNNAKLKVNLMDKESIKYVSAKNQAIILDDLIYKDIFTQDELYTIKRARNYRPNSKPHSTKIKEYKKATALEALFGMLYLKKDYKRIEQLMKEITGD